MSHVLCRLRYVVPLLGFFCLYLFKRDFFDNHVCCSLELLQLLLGLVLFVQHQVECDDDIAIENFSV